MRSPVSRHAVDGHGHTTATGLENLLEVRELHVDGRLAQRLLTFIQEGDREGGREGGREGEERGGERRSIVNSR